jgi:hypothetical protein
VFADQDEPCGTNAVGRGVLSGGPLWLRSARTGRGRKDDCFVDQSLAKERIEKPGPGFDHYCCSVPGFTEESQDGREVKPVGIPGKRQDFSASGAELTDEAWRSAHRRLGTAQQQG